jgi:hypothetical protein
MSKEDGFAYWDAPGNVKTTSCFKEEDFTVVWEGADRVRNDPIFKERGDG